MLFRPPHAALAAGLVLLLSACDKDKDGTPVESDSDVGGEPVATTIRFRAVFDGSSASCEDSYDGIGTGDARVRLVDFRAYLHDVFLIDSKGAEHAFTLSDDGTYSDGAVGLVDFATDQGDCEGGAGRNTQLVGTAPDLAYNGIRFTIGLPRDVALTPLDGARPPLDLPDLFKNSTLGRLHSRVAVLADNASAPNVNEIHALCQSTADCQAENTLTVTLPGFDPGSDSVLFDLAALLSRNDVTKDGCSGLAADADCRTYFVSYGLGAGGPEWISVD